MKKVIFILGFLGLIILNPLLAQNDSVEVVNTDTVLEMSETSDSSVEEVVVSETVEVQEPETSELESEAIPEEDTSVSQALKLKFIEGGPLFMSFVLIALILGLALSIERIIYLNLATTNSKQLLEDIENALSNGGVEAAKEVCRNTRGPVASIFLQGLERSSEGVEMVEKSGNSLWRSSNGIIRERSFMDRFIYCTCTYVGFYGNRYWNDSGF